MTITDSFFSQIHLSLEKISYMKSGEEEQEEEEQEEEAEASIFWENTSSHIIYTLNIIGKFKLLTFLIFCSHNRGILATEKNKKSSAMTFALTLLRSVIVWFVTVTWRLISHGRTPFSASCTILSRVSVGNGRPLINSPPSWFIDDEQNRFFS